MFKYLKRFRLRLDVVALTIAILAVFLSTGSGQHAAVQASQLFERFTGLEVYGWSTTRPTVLINDRATGGKILDVQQNSVSKVWVASGGVLHSVQAIVAPAVYTQTATPTNTPTNTPTPTFTATPTNTPVPPTATP